MADPVQNFKNHVRFVPGFHFVLALLVVINLVWCLQHAIRHYSTAALDAVITAVALMLTMLYARRFAVTVQDRVIRLEMRLRLQRMMPNDPQIGALTLDQLIALRFAGDKELAELTRRVLEQNIRDRKTIKQWVKDWQADTLRV